MASVDGAHVDEMNWVLVWKTLKLTEKLNETASGAAERTAIMYCGDGSDDDHDGDNGELTIRIRNRQWAVRRIVRERRIDQTRAPLKLLTFIYVVALIAWRRCGVKWHFVKAINHEPYSVGTSLLRRKSLWNGSGDGQMFELRLQHSHRNSSRLTHAECSLGWNKRGARASPGRVPPPLPKCDNQLVIPACYANGRMCRISIIFHRHNSAHCNWKDAHSHTHTHTHMDALHSNSPAIWFNSIPSSHSSDSIETIMVAIDKQKPFKSIEWTNGFA